MLASMTVSSSPVSTIVASVEPDNPGQITVTPDSSVTLVSPTVPPGGGSMNTS